MAVGLSSAYRLCESDSCTFVGVTGICQATPSRPVAMSRLRRLLCFLVHKFGRRDVDDFEAYLKEMETQVRPDGWRGVPPRENVVKAGLYGVLQDAAEAERIFAIIRVQTEY
jgi:hypothetical protein